MKTFDPGARVRLTEAFFEAPAGTTFTVVEMVGPGFFLPGTVKVAALDVPVPIVGGSGTVGLIHCQFLEATP